MIIHSVMPASYLQEAPTLPTASLRSIEGGYLEGHDTPQGFETSRIISTDLSHYLKKEYAPGSILPGQGHC